MEFQPEQAEDWWEVEALYDLCFSPGRTALSSYRLREDVPPAADLSLILRDDLGNLCAAIRFWPISVGGQDAMLLGPIAVHPTRQGEGIGGALIREGLERAERKGQHRVLLVGDAPYYARFGFHKLADIRMPPPTNPDRVLGYGDWTDVAGEVRKSDSR